MNPTLIINRVVIFNHDIPVYDEKFHTGVNIIRGDNSSGKSTIANFIFYGLGGDFSAWNSDAEKCTTLSIEVKLNNLILTLRRNIVSKEKQGMFIFKGSYDDSIKANYHNWNYYNYSNIKEKSNFSKILFELLGFPEIKGELDTTISMHQILRLLYIDQKSLTNSFFKTESFDSLITRVTVFELLIGLYDNDLYSNRIAQKNLEKEIDLDSKQYKSIYDIYNSSTNQIEKNFIEEKIKNLRLELKKTNDIISYIYDKQNIPTEIIGNKKNIFEIKDELNKTQSIFLELSSESSVLTNEIADSSFFIETLERRKKALDVSLITKNELENIDFTNCPQCFSEKKISSSIHICSLCKEPIENTEQKYLLQIARMQQELNFQIKESKDIMNYRMSKLEKKNIEIDLIRQKLLTINSEMDNILNTNKSIRNNILDTHLVLKGKFESDIEYFTNQLTIAAQVQNIKNRILAKKEELSILKIKYQKLEKQQHEQKNNAHQIIQQIALFLLENDLERQKEFKLGGKIEINLSHNTYSLNGQNNFSESSNTYLKNAIRFALFFASLENTNFRYPRFILSDNMEDKGMEEARSQKFQELVVALSKKSNVTHQIIFTTSMINPDLNNSEFCIGEFYTSNNKTLKFTNSK
jgi:hypothetical protein